MKSKIINGLVIGFVSVLLSACDEVLVVVDDDHVDRIAEFSGDWESECIYNPNTGVAVIDTTYISGTSFTTYKDEFYTTDCSDHSDYTTIIDGHLGFGADARYASSYCGNAIKVDFIYEAIEEDGITLSQREIKDYFDLPSNTLYDIMCTDGGELYRGNRTNFNGKYPSTRPATIDHSNPFFEL